MARHNDFGKEGEGIAKEYLLKKGDQLIDQNWRKGKHEIDLVVKRNDTLIFVEVKSRNNAVTDVSDVLSNMKEKALLNAVNAYLEDVDESVNCQIDIIVIEKKDTSFNVNHIEDAISQ